MATVEELIASLMKPLLETLSELPQFYVDSEDKVFMTLMEYEWFPDIEVTCLILPQLLTYVESGQTDKAEKFYRKYCLRHYNKEYLTEVVDRWEEHRVLAKRIPILRQAVDAHCNGQYFLSVPVLMAQIEGIVWDAKNHVGRIQQSKLRGLIYDLGMSKSAVEFIVNHLLAYFEYGQNQVVNISRNAILHGYDTDYGTIVNSLKLIMMINLLSVVIDG